MNIANIGVYKIEIFRILQESYYKYQDIEKFAQSSKKGSGRDAKL